ncbi:hypothetical protein EJ08DRAFT_670522 [Tothia fuscella]|uniref:Cation efflux protein transmembrane domain-containing protein n=1 Tax=Tothia fuscella TaxID=1048955 RepID=A0A9P4NSB5_9PEZI|nr:hypothetical protein EJ08DRAFT_670522 [Tothia fuscella]
MVGRRPFTGGNNYANDYDSNKPDSLSRRKPKAYRFEDDSSKEMEDEQREQLKNTLIDGVERDHMEKYRRTTDEIKKCSNKKLRLFYEQQNEMLNDWLEVDTAVRSIADDILESFDPDRDHDGIREGQGALQTLGEDVEAFLPEEERQLRQKEKRKAKLAININVVANVLLLAAKIGAVFFSQSLSLIASLVDSALDLLCTIIIWSTNKLVAWRMFSLQKRFPVGRRRLEPLGILVFSIIMVISFAQILQESVEKLLPSGDHSTAELGKYAIFAMVSTIVVKGIIWFGCIKIKTTQVQALAQDCKTDVFFNTLTLLFPVIGHRLNIWWLDPVGAGLLSLFIIFDWGGTAFENVTRLSGSAVDDRMLRKLIFLAWRFHPVVDGFKNIKAYHAGDGVWVEVDILLDPKTVLMRSHDISETLQYCLEGLPEVDRAFVTVDYASAGPSGHSTALI